MIPSDLIAFPRNQKVLNCAVEDEGEGAKSGRTSPKPTSAQHKHSLLRAQRNAHFYSSPDCTAAAASSHTHCLGTDSTVYYHRALFEGVCTTSTVFVATQWLPGGVSGDTHGREPMPRCRPRRRQNRLDLGPTSTGWTSDGGPTVSPTSIGWSTRRMRDPLQRHPTG